MLTRCFPHVPGDVNASVRCGRLSLEGFAVFCGGETADRLAAQAVLQPAVYFPRLGGNYRISRVRL